MSESPRTPWLIRIALAAFPPAFRRAHAAEMEEDYAEARSACATRAARARLVVRTMVDMVGSGLRERRRAARSSSPTAANDGIRGSGPWMIWCVTYDTPYAAWRDGRASL